ncbi:hypothetical protein Dsin_012407 [Dipteronia sinensis]|uniref:Uncharacterized protein n=1 Tax=Dipteronia sinensis TaxID=43782 RepID=A0AAE0E8F7_9ROSI|nr:hypothetical protein Dsin_012407 [Dipteronia sinensis]
MTSLKKPYSSLTSHILSRSAYLATLILIRIYVDNAAMNPGGKNRGRVGVSKNKGGIRIPPTSKMQRSMKLQLDRVMFTPLVRLQHQNPPFILILGISTFPVPLVVKSTEHGSFHNTKHPASHRADISSSSHSVWLEKRYVGSRHTSEWFNTAGRNVKTGFIASVIVSQVLLFGVMAIEIKRKAPHAHTVCEIVKARCV